MGKRRIVPDFDAASFELGALEQAEINNCVSQIQHIFARRRTGGGALTARILIGPQQPHQKSWAGLIVGPEAPPVVAEIIVGPEPPGSNKPVRKLKRCPNCTDGCIPD